MSTPDRYRPDHGETLIEILMTVVILGICAVGLIGALSTGVVASDSHRRLTDAETLTRSYGELVKNTLLHEPQATLTADRSPASYAAGDTVTFPVDTTSAFTTTPPYVAVDGAVVKVSGMTASSITGTAQAAGGDGKGAVIRRYDTCVAPSFFDDLARGVVPAGNRTGTPSVTSVSYYARDNSLVATVTSDGDAGQAACRGYRTRPGATVCSGTDEWRTVCDPAWLRVTVAVSGGTGTSADILVRRVS